MPLRSLLEREVPAREAELQLDALRAQGRDFGIAGGLAMLGTLVALGIELRLAVILGIAAAMMLALGGRSVWRRRELIAALLRERDAYRIVAVRHQGARFATPARRRRLAAWLRKLVRVAESQELPASLNLRPIDDRVRPRRQRMLEIADALDAKDPEIHPASVALLHQLLTRPAVSPLYNPGLDEDLLDLAFHRIEAGLTTRG